MTGQICSTSRDKMPLQNYMYFHYSTCENTITELFSLLLSFTLQPCSIADNLLRKLFLIKFHCRYKCTTTNLNSNLNTFHILLWPTFFKSHHLIITQARKKKKRKSIRVCIFSFNFNNTFKMYYFLPLCFLI